MSNAPIGARSALLMLVVLVCALGGCVPVPAPGSPTTPIGESAPAPSAVTDLALPGSFRYEVELRSAGGAEGGAKHAEGAYRDGDWSQITRTEGAFSNSSGQTEQSVVVAGSSFTRPVGETGWTRWPSLGFDASYGLTSPFTVLRLYRLADQRTDRTVSRIAGAPEATFKVQTSIAPETVKQVLAAGIAVIASGEQPRAVLEAQVAPLIAPQTITYWVGEDDRIYRAAATLLAADETGQPVPWVEATWQFWDYGNPQIAIEAPEDSQEALKPGTSGQPAQEAGGASAPDVSGSLVVRVFSAPGIPAKHLAVTVYPAGETHQPLDWRTDAEAEFSLPPAAYDVLVQMDNAQERIQGVQVARGETTTREVVFDFGVLEVSAIRAGRPVPVEVVVYPAGDRENWVDWRSENPAIIPLRAGQYDVEVFAADQSGTRRMLPGVMIRPGQTRQETLDLKR